MLRCSAITGEGAGAGVRGGRLLTREGEGRTE